MRWSSIFNFSFIFWFSIWKVFFWAWHSFGRGTVFSRIILFFFFGPTPEKLRCLALVGWGMGVVGCRDRDFQIPRTRFSPSTNFQWNPTISNFYTAPPLFWTDRQVLANGIIVECRTYLNSIDLLFCIFSKGVTSFEKNNMAASLATVATCVCMCIWCERGLVHHSIPTWKIFAIFYLNALFMQFREWP